AEVARRVEQARVPPLPVRQKFLDFAAQAHAANVYEEAIADNDGVTFYNTARLDFRVRTRSRISGRPGPTIRYSAGF
ncbi:MAG: hypothetical protein OEV63_04830, partial [Gammaproteobacteria bacterium]|nr:hypothetical protein [Gammaproteobacteria bacterium]